MFIYISSAADKPVFLVGKERAVENVFGIGTRGQAHDGGELVNRSVEACRIQLRQSPIVFVSSVKMKPLRETFSRSNSIASSVAGSRRFKAAMAIEGSGTVALLLRRRN